MGAETLHRYREQMLLATWEHNVGPRPTDDLKGLFQCSWFYVMLPGL